MILMRLFVWLIYVVWNKIVFNIFLFVILNRVWVKYFFNLVCISNGILCFLLFRLIFIDLVMVIFLLVGIVLFKLWSVLVINVLMELIWNLCVSIYEM